MSERFCILTRHGTAETDTIAEATAAAMQLCPGCKVIYGASGGAVHDYGQIMDGVSIRFPEERVGFIAFPGNSWLTEESAAFQALPQ